MTRVACCLSLVVVVAPSAAHAQKPDLSGIWTAVPGQAPSSLPTAPVAILGARIGVKVEGSTLSLTRPVRDVSMISTFTLDGARVTTRVPGRLCEGERIVQETAAWEGEALALTTVGMTPAGGGPTIESQNRTILRLEAPDRLTVEGTMVQQGQRRQVGTVYRRATEPLPPPRAALPTLGIAATISQVAWIGATWVGTAGSVTTEERWTPPASGGMMATARTLRSGALASFEFLCIAERDGSLAYVAMPDARNPPTIFMLTALTATSATFENPGHDYPKSIRYAQTADGGLETTIAGANGARAQSVTLRK